MKYAGHHARLPDVPRHPPSRNPETLRRGHHGRVRQETGQVEVERRQGERHPLVLPYIDALRPQTSMSLLCITCLDHSTNINQNSRRLLLQISAERFLPQARQTWEVAQRSFQTLQQQGFLSSKSNSCWTDKLRSLRSGENNVFSCNLSDETILQCNLLLFSSLVVLWFEPELRLLAGVLTKFEAFFINKP